MRKFLITCLFSLALPGIASAESYDEVVAELEGMDLADMQLERFEPTEVQSRSAAFRCSGTTTLGGFGDTIRRSDTRACGGGRRADIVPRGGFVPGVQRRTLVASLTPCVSGTATLFTTDGKFIVAGKRRGGCPNGRATIDFCAAGGGAVQIAQRFGEQTILQWQTARGVECFRVFPRYTTRNGQCVPNRPGVNERGEAPLQRWVCK
jgi:hypothetical protein